jgi:NTP pyrophosphatase (non-canonical NTP hydrolase)
MTDRSTTVAELRVMVEAFVAERDWHPFHNGKDLAVSIAIEAAELLEEFQWQAAEGTTAAEIAPEHLERVRLELADVLIYCLSFSNALQLDISQAIRDKLALSALKYPAGAYRGLARKPGGAS